MIGVLIVLGIYGFIMFRIFLQLINKPKVSIKVPTFNYVFGVPGCGKTSLLTYLAKLANKHHIKVYSNVDLNCIDFVKIKKSDVGVKNIHDGLLLIDESSIDFNNRLYKTMSQKAIEYFKKHRHYNVSVYIFSQSWEDTDITLRRLSTRYYYLRKSRLFFLDNRIVVKRIRKVIDVDDLTKQIIDGYGFIPLSKFTFNQRKVRSYFNSFERDLTLEEFEDYKSFNDVAAEPEEPYEPGEPESTYKPGGTVKADEKGGVFI